MIISSALRLLGQIKLNKSLRTHGISSQYLFSTSAHNGDNDDINNSKKQYTQQGNHHFQNDKRGQYYQQTQNKSRQYTSPRSNGYSEGRQSNRYSNEKSKGVLGYNQQQELLELRNIVLNAGIKKGEDSDDEGNQNKGSNDRHFNDEKNNRIIAETTKVFSYQRQNLQSFLEVIKICQDNSKVETWSFIQVSAIIIEFGRSPFKKSHIQKVQGALNVLLTRWEAISPLIQLMKVIEDAGQFEKDTFSYQEYEFLRDTIPQILISTQNCNYTRQSVLKQYAIFINAGGISTSGMFLKTSLSLAWVYAKFGELKQTQQQSTSESPRFDLFVEYALSMKQHMHFLNSLRLLWMACVTESIQESNTNVERMKGQIQQSYYQQNILIFNSKNSIHILQTLYVLYPDLANDIHKGNVSVLNEYSQKDQFFKTMLPSLNYARDVLQFKAANPQKYKIIVFNKSANTTTEFIKPQQTFMSNFEKNVQEVLKFLNPKLNFTFNVHIADAYEIDILLADQRIAFEINGGSHYFFNTNTKQFQLFPTYFLKQRHMKMFGVDHMVPINQFEWEKLTTIEEMRLYILKQLEGQGINASEIFPNGITGDQKIKFVSRNLQHLNTP